MTLEELSLEEMLALAKTVTKWNYSYDSKERYSKDILGDEYYDGDDTSMIYSGVILKGLIKVKCIAKSYAYYNINVVYEGESVGYKSEPFSKEQEISKLFHILEKERESKETKEHENYKNEQKIKREEKIIELRRLINN